jgi:hypothetical protein
MAHNQTWSLNDKTCFLDSCVLQFHATDMNAQLVACLDHKDCNLVLHIFSRLGNLQCTGFESTSESVTAGRRSKQAFRFSFISTGSSIPVLGDSCFILSVVGKGGLQQILLYNTLCLISFSGRPSQNLAALFCHVGIEAAHEDSFKVENESKLYLGAGNVVCTVSSSVLFKFNTSKLNSTINLENRSQSNQESGVAIQIDECRNGPGPVSSHISSDLSTNSLMVTEHYMTVS